MSTEQLLKDEFMSRFSSAPGHFKILISSVTQTEHRHLRLKKCLTSSPFFESACRLNNLAI